LARQWCQAASVRLLIAGAARHFWPSHFHFHVFYTTEYITKYNRKPTNHKGLDIFTRTEHVKMSH
jgi:hypothetical protein